MQQVGPVAALPASVVAEARAIVFAVTSAFASLPQQVDFTVQQYARFMQQVGSAVGDVAVSAAFVTSATSINKVLPQHGDLMVQQ